MMVGLGLAAVLAGYAVESSAWSPPSQAAARPYTTVVDRYLASEHGPNGWVFGPAGHWFCATRFLGAATSGDRVTVYVWALCDEWKRSGDRIVSGGGESLPVVVYLRNADGHLHGVSFDEPGDAPDYAPDVRRLFPGDVADWILSHPGDVTDLQQNVIAQARRSLLPQ